MNAASGQANGQDTLKPSQDMPDHPLTDADFDDICHLVAEICHTPINLVSVIAADRQWFRSHHPLITADLSADFAFCAQAQHYPTDIFIVNDLQKDYRFGKHLLVTAVPYAAFYCGVPLLSADNTSIGVLNIWDNKPREFSATQLAALQSLSRQVAQKIELRNQVAWLQEDKAELKAAYADLDSFTTLAAHDLKSPLNAIISLTDLVRANYSETLDEEGSEYINFLHTAALNLAGLVTAVFNYSRATAILSEHREDVNLQELVHEIKLMLLLPDHVTISVDASGTVYTNRTALTQILMRLVDNAVKYSDKEQVKISISAPETPTAYTISVNDNGPGLPADVREKIFELFKKSKHTSAAHIATGLPIVKRLIEKLDGSITIESGAASGSTFILSLPK